MPGDESSFCRSTLSHAGQAAARLAVTKASKCRPQPRHAYSNRGIDSYCNLEIWEFGNRLPVHRFTSLRDSHQRGTEDLVADAVAVAHDADDAAVLRGIGRWDRGNGFVKHRVERGPLARDAR